MGRPGVARGCTTGKLVSEIRGSDVMIFSVYQANLFFSSSFLGSCEMPLSLCYEQLVSAAQSCNPSEAGILSQGCLV